MRGLLIFASGAVVALLIQTAIAQNFNDGVIQLNHVGIAVEDMDESLAFYTDTIGFEEAFRVTNDEGRVGLAYLRVSETTFVELQPANENRPVGLNHFGIQVEGMEAVKAMFESRGASPGETRRGSTQAILSNISDPQGVRIELSEYPSDSLQGKALAGE
jgi:catechol 2,3-dioxygenase-like lactoylglutathione lyase family enzyme